MSDCCARAVSRMIGIELVPERLVAAPRLDDLVAVELEQNGDEGENVFVVVGDENGRAAIRLRTDHAVASMASTGSLLARSGSSTRKVVPLPSLLSTVIRPPCASTMALTIASPRPVPGMASSAAAVERKKRSNSFG